MKVLNEQLSEELVTKMYSTMVRLNVMDTILYDAQRQGLSLANVPLCLA